MDKKTINQISSLLVLRLLFALFLFQAILSAPTKSVTNSSISTIPYSEFLKNITAEKCAFPNGVVLPFKQSAFTFQYFAEPLKICASPESTKRSLEAVRLCNEIYETLRNITCHSNKNVQLPEILIEFSDNVCKEINSLKLEHSLVEDGVLQHLTDEFVCDMMCEGDFLPACRVLFWGFQIQKQINSIPQIQSIQNTQVPENANAVNVNNAQSSDPKTLRKSENVDLGKTENPQPSLSKQDLSDRKNPSDKKVDETQKIANEDASENELAQSLKTDKDESINQENEVPEEPVVQEKTENQENKKKEELNPDKQDQLQEKKIEAVITKEKVVEAKAEVTSPDIKTPPANENKVNTADLPTKNSESSDSAKTVIKNKPAVIPIPEKAKDVINKTRIEGTVVVPQNDLPTETPKESQIDDENIPNNLKPENDEADKEHDKVSLLPTPSKVLPNEAKVEIKSEVSPKDTEVSDTKLVPTIGKEEAASVTTVADLEKMEEGNGIPDFPEKDQEAYNDSESDGEYSKLDYGDDAAFMDSSKSKKPEEPDSGRLSKPSLIDNDFAKYDVPQRNTYGRGVERQAFEQEDSHFFFYFLSLILIIMGGYLLFHNKQKIIALIVEGRHERRRRSHGAAYKKLETK